MKPFIALTLAITLVLLALPAHAQKATPPAPRKPAAARATPMPKPRIMVALVFGQSNAGNWGESPKAAGPSVFYFFRGEYGRARDPLRGANGDGGSVWTRLGDKVIAARLYDRVVFVPAAIGATDIALWAPGGLLHEDLLRNVREAKDAGHIFTHLLWHQGESDAVLGTRKEDYQQRFIAMLAALRALGVDAPAFVAVATRCGDYPPNAEIRAAQTELVNPALGIFAGPDTDQLDTTFRHDGCHFSNAGLDAHAEMWLKVLEDHAQGPAAKGQP
jgi:hypothetical protein